jgi:hypothetical protein
MPTRKKSVTPLDESISTTEPEMSTIPSQEALLPVETPTPTAIVPEASPKGATRWKPGQSGNPAGRPKGSKSAITLWKLALEQYLREEASDHMGEVLLKAISMAKKGNTAMIKLLLELHMSKSGDVDDHGTDSKIQININSMGNDQPAPIIIEQTKET